MNKLLLSQKLPVDFSSGFFISARLSLKTTIILMLILALNIRSFASTKKVSLSLNEVELERVFEEIGKQTDYLFLYDDNVIEHANKVSIFIEDALVTDVMNLLAKRNGLTYKVLSGTISVSKVLEKKNIDKASIQDEIIVSGIVKGVGGEVLVGASIQVKNKSTIGTRADSDGKFTLRVPNNSVLVASYVGHLPMELTAKVGGILNFVLQDEESSLDEVVVVGYGTQKKTEITGSISSVKGSDVAEKPTLSFDGALSGKATGVNMTANAGVVNQAPVFRIRGTNSLSLSSYPLVVVDGVPVFTENVSVGGNASNNPLSAINTADIESIDIAKDAAATSIYGSRAANGVVFITTKSGKKGKAKFSYNGFYGVNKAVRLAPVLNTDQYLEIKNEGLKNARTYDPVKNYYGTSLDAAGNIINTNWYDYIFRTGNTQNHNVSVSGANEATKYYFSVGVTDQEGILRGNDYNRKSVNYNIEHKVNDWLKVGSKTSYSDDETMAILSTGTGVNSVSSNSVAYRLGFITAPIVGPYNRDGSFNIIGPNVGIMDNVGHLTATARLGYTNPVLTLSTNDDNTANNYLQSNNFLEVKPLEWITLRTIYGVNNMYSRTNRYFDPRTNEAGSTNGRATGVSAKNEITVWTNTATLNRAFGQHSLDLLLGHEEQTSKGDRFGLIRSNQSDPFYTDLQGGFSEVAISNTANQRYYNFLTSLFTRVQYNYERKYFLSANLRRDESSVLGKNNKQGTFWGFSGAWEVSQESFWGNLQISTLFDSFKLRASYGKVGNLSGIGDYASLSTYSANLYGGLAGLYYSAAGNQDLKWETSKKIDIGLSFGILQNRLNVDLAYYKNNIDGLIFGVPTPSSAGIPGSNQNSVLANVGSMYNKGLELGLNGSILQNEYFNWNSSFNFSYNKNEVTKLSPTVTSLIFNDVGGSSGQVSISLPGYPVGMIYAIRTEGVDPATGRRIFLDGSGKKVFYQQVPSPGRYQWEYEDGSRAAAVSTTKDGVIYKNTNPKFYGGFTNTFKYRGIDLDVLLTYQTGGYMYYATQASLMDYRFQNNSTKILDRWQKPGDITDVPRVQDGDITSWGYSIPITANVYSSDFIRLKNVTLGYTLPPMIMDKLKISAIRLYLSGQNLALITNYPGSDPEVTSTGNATATQGFDKNMTPNARTFIMGIQVGF